MQIPKALSVSSKKKIDNISHAEGDIPVPLPIHATPDTVKHIIIESKKAEKLADLGLHKVDLEFALECVEAIPRTLKEYRKQALWFSAIIYYIKCFTGSCARGQLRKDIYKNHKLGIESFDYFKGLRDKHIAHDENLGSQGMVVAAINNGSKPHKIEGIYSVSAKAITIIDEDIKNLYLLIKIALEYVEEQSIQIREALRLELENETYENLNSRKDAAINKSYMKRSKN